MQKSVMPRWIESKGAMRAKYFWQSLPPTISVTKAEILGSRSLGFSSRFCDSAVTIQQNCQQFGIKFWLKFWQFQNFGDRDQKLRSHAPNFWGSGYCRNFLYRIYMNRICAHHGSLWLKSFLGSSFQYENTYFSIEFQRSSRLKTGAHTRRQNWQQSPRRDAARTSHHIDSFIRT